MKYTIRTVATMTGLSQYTIRAWERRHHVLSPDRTETNRRLYDDSDVARLQLLKQSIDAGHSIGQAAQLTNEDLRALSTYSQEEQPRLGNPINDIPHGSFLDAAIIAMDQLDEDALRESLLRGATMLGLSPFIEGVVLPLMSHVEHRWIEKSISIAQEHMVSAVVRTTLEHLRTSISNPTDAPRLLVTTPKGQFHEIGALIVSVIAGLEAWQVTYLGPNLPAYEIAGAVRQSGSKALALSLVYPVDDPEIKEELTTLRGLLGDSFPILVGGRGAHDYLISLTHLDLTECHELSDFRTALADISNS